MIPHLSTPSICVIDDEQEDYEPILNALMTLGLGCVHVRGRNEDPLPPQPFRGLRVVFADLHLNGQTGKAAASHTAQVARKVISGESGPVVVIIWSKYCSDPAGDPELPPEDQPTEADLFKEALLGSDPNFKSRLFFTQMSKPKLPDRESVDAWTEQLKSEIVRTLAQVDSFDILWIWENLIHSAGIDVSETLISLAGSDENPASNEDMMTIMRLLAHKQGGPDLSETTVTRHLLNVFAHVVTDSLERALSSANLDCHASRLAVLLDDDVRKKHHSPKLNTLLLTIPSEPAFAVFTPGTVYRITDNGDFEKATGFSVDRLKKDCFDGDPDRSPNFKDFAARAEPVLLEITPECDFHQGHRRCATLLAGLLVPADLGRRASARDSCKMTPVIQHADGAAEKTKIDAAFVFCGRYRCTLHLELGPPQWLEPKLRFRTVLLADIRNWHSGQSSRVGYLSF